MIGGVGLDVYRIAFLAIISIAGIYSGNQWRLTKSSNPEFPVRRDVGLLTLTLFFAGIGEAIRNRFSENPAYLLAGSLILLPFVFIAIFLCWRIFKAYQGQSKSSKLKH